MINEIIKTFEGFIAISIACVLYIHSKTAETISTPSITWQGWLTSIGAIFAIVYYGIIIYEKIASFRKSKVHHKIKRKL